MKNSYDLTKLDSNSFENLITSIAIKVLGNGTTGFGPGPDGGRDSYFEGEAPYPSETERWKGTWYLQSKFFRPHLSKNPQEWLIEQIRLELQSFSNEKSARQLPDIWIVATNIDPSGVARTGAWDKAKRLVREAFPKLKFDIWGGSKILTLLSHHPTIADAYSHFLTPSDILNEMRNSLRDRQADVKAILHNLIVNQFTEQIHTKLDQAGSAEDSRPGIHHLFIDLPYECPEQSIGGDIATDLIRTSARNHRPSQISNSGEQWQKWDQDPQRARILILKGGPGQGKSTVGQYFAQVQRAALIQSNTLQVPLRYRPIVEEVRLAAEDRGHYPAVPRIPVLIELKDFAQWFGRRRVEDSNGVLSYLSNRIQKEVALEVLPGTLKRALAIRGWFFIFDGLDEVPNDVKDPIALEIRRFLENTVTEIDADVLAICTSRPQGYSGQFDMLEGPVCALTKLPSSRALACCEHIMKFARSPDDAARLMNILKAAINSPAVRELMTTPLQSHIMAVVVRNGGRPPERRWLLFMNYYNIMKKREVLKNFGDARVARMLAEQDKLLKSIHSKMGFSLHVRAETAEGAQTQLSRREFESLVEHTVSELMESDVIETVAVLMEATTQRLVFVNTPDSAKFVRFDIRQLQEFFAAEFLYEGVDGDTLNERLRVVAGDSHWLEVMHFVLSSLVENSRTTELAISVQELQRINQIGDTSSEQMLSRRTARGAYLTVRLVQEGVLDQDKQIRNQFKSALIPILGTLEREAIYPLAYLRDSDTKKWFLNFCIESLSTLVEYENINSILYLIFLLNDNDPRKLDVIQYFKKASLEYRRYVISFLCLSNSKIRRRHISELSYWAIDIIINAYISDEINNFDSRTIVAIRDILSDQRIKDYIENSREIEDSIKEIIFFSFDREPLFRSGNTIKIGFLEGVLFENDWINGKFPTEIWKNGIPKNLEDGNNIIGIITTILLFAKNRDQDTLNKLLKKVLKCGLGTFFSLSSHVRAMVPSRNGDCCDHIYWEELVNMSEEKFREKIRILPRRTIRRERPIAAWVISNSGGNSYEWNELINCNLRYALLLFTRPSQRSAPPEVSEFLINALISNPIVALNYIEILGPVINACPAKANELKQEMINETLCFEDNGHIWNGGRIQSFSINASTESKLLPFLLRNIRNRSINGEIEVGADTLKSFTPNINELFDFIYDIKRDKDEYAAALVFTLAHLLVSNDNSYSDKIIEDVCEEIVKSYRSEISEWYIFGLTLTLIRPNNRHQKHARQLLGRLLELCNKNYTSRAYLHYVVAEGRERSVAPVHNSKLKERYLAINQS